MHTQLTATNALPATPEVNEEHSGRSTSPETKRQTTDTTGIYNYGQSYSAYNPTKFVAKKRPLSECDDGGCTSVRPKRRSKPKKRCCLFRLGCRRFGRGRSGVYRVRNDSLPYFVRSSSVRPVGFNRISPPPVSLCNEKNSQPSLHSSPAAFDEQQPPRPMDVTKGRIRLNLYAYPSGYLRFLESYFACDDNDVIGTAKKRLSAISEEDVCPLCGGSIDYTSLTKTATGRWKNPLLIPF